MSIKNTDSDKKIEKRDPDLAAAEIAMKRAAAKARQRAWQAGLGIMVWKDGKVVEEANRGDSLNRPE